MLGRLFIVFGCILGSLIWFEVVSRSDERQENDWRREVDIEFQDEKPERIWGWVETTTNLPVLAVAPRESRSFSISLKGHTLAEVLDRIAAQTQTEWFLSKDPNLLVFKASRLPREFVAQREKSLEAAIELSNSLSVDCLNTMARGDIVATTDLSSSSASFWKFPHKRTPDAEAIRCPMSEDFRKDALAVAAYPASIRSVGDVDLIVPEPTSTVGSRQEYEGVRPTTLQELAASNRMRIARGPNLRDRGIPFDAKLFDGETTYNLAELDKQVELFIVAKTLVARETRDEMARMQKERVATGQSTSIRDMWRGGWDGGIDMDALQDGAIRATDEEVQTALQKLKLSRANVILEIPVFCLLITEWKPSEMFGPDIFESVRQRIVDIPIKSP